MTADLALVVTAHDETAVSGPTMRSADRAVAAARDAGLSVQTVVVLDAATAATAAYFGQSCFDHWERQVFTEGDPGRVRDTVGQQLDSRYVAFLDADCLVSDNWLAAGVAALDEAAGRGERAIAHPELDVVFDGARTIRVNLDQRSSLFTPHYLYLSHYYDSLCLAPCEAHLEIPYAGRAGHGQDSRFTIETLEAGWRHLVVRDTIIFTRHRDVPAPTTGSRPPDVTGTLTGMAIDRVRDLRP